MSSNRLIDVRNVDANDVAVSDPLSVGKAVTDAPANFNVEREGSPAL